MVLKNLAPRSVCVWEASIHPSIPLTQVPFDNLMISELASTVNVSVPTTRPKLKVVLHGKVHA
jgi:hypothetical protein